MSDIATVSLSISGKIDTTGLTVGMSLSSTNIDLSATPEVNADQNTSATTYTDYPAFGAIAWNEVTWAAFKNLSSTDGEDITLAAKPHLVAGLTDDGTVAGASLPATLTAAGYYKTISDNGTSVSPARAWEKGDIAVYLGSSGAYAQIRPGPFAVIEPGMAMLLKIQTQGTSPFVFKSLTGTPRLGHAVVGALA